VRDRLRPRRVPDDVHCPGGQLCAALRGDPVQLELRQADHVPSPEMRAAMREAEV